MHKICQTTIEAVSSCSCLITTVSSSSESNWDDTKLVALFRKSSGVLAFDLEGQLYSSLRTQLARLMIRLNANATISTCYRALSDPIQIQKDAKTHNVSYTVKGKAAVCGIRTEKENCTGCVQDTRFDEDSHGSLKCCVLLQTVTKL